MKTKKKFGYTLIELIVSIALISLAFYSLINVISMVASKSVDSQTITTATFLAQGKMEEWIQKDYYAIGTPKSIAYTSEGTLLTDWICFDQNVSAAAGVPGYYTTLDYPKGEYTDYYYRIMLDYISNRMDLMTIEIVPPSQGYETFDLKRLKVQVKKVDQNGSTVFETALLALIKPDDY